MIDATLLSKEETFVMGGRAGEQVYSIRTYSIPSVEPADSTGITDSDEIRLPTPHFTEATIFGIRVACLSTDYTVSIRTSPDIILPSIRQILRIENINELHSENNLDISYFNPALEEYLYAIISNEDAALATGVIDLELIFLEGKKVLPMNLR